MGGGRGKGWGAAYEAEKKGGKIRCLLLRRKKKNIFYLFMKSLLGIFFKNRPLFTTYINTYIIYILIYYNIYILYSIYIYIICILYIYYMYVGVCILYIYILYVYM